MTSPPHPLIISCKGLPLAKPNQILGASESQEICLQILVPCNTERISEEIDLTTKSCDDLGECSWQVKAMQRIVGGEQKEKKTLVCDRKIKNQCGYNFGP